MSDLVAELRWKAANEVLDCECMDTAADEIERLTAERDGWKEKYEAGTRVWNPVYKKILDERDEWKAAAQEACDENNALRAERDRLQQELAIATATKLGPIQHYVNEVLQDRARLRAALEQYGDHRVSCPISGVFPPHEGVGYVCTCGYEKALAGGEK